MNIFMAVICCRRDKNNGCLSWFRQQLNNSIDYKIFFGSGSEVTQSDEILLPVDDNYQNLPWKVQQAFRWVLNQSQQYSHILKIDCDSRVWSDRLLKLSIEDFDYIGNFADSKLPILRPDTYAGSSYIVSRYAAVMHVNADIKKILQHPRTYPPFDKAWIEDEFTGKVLSQTRRLHTEKFQLHLAGRMYSGPTDDLVVLCNEFSTNRNRK